jgi:cytochrome c
MKTQTLLISALLASALWMGAAGAAAPADRANAKEAEAMVKKGVALIKTSGRDKALAEISNKKGQFIDRDLYLVVYRMDGVNVAHGVNEKMIGKNMIEIKDIDGKEYMRERVELAKAKPSFWHDLKFVDPITRKIEPKQMYCERVEDLMVCGGIYKM